MDLRVFLDAVIIKNLRLSCYSVMNKNDALVSKDGEFFSCSFFADAYLFINLNVLKNYIDQNDLKKDNFTVVKTFSIFKSYWLRIT